MTDKGPVISRFGLDHHGVRNYNVARWNLGVPDLIEETLRRGDGALAEGGALVVLTGQHTGRSPNDKFTVEEPDTSGDIWWGDTNVAISEAGFEGLYKKVLAYFENRDLFVQDLHAGADPEYRLPVRVVSESAWHSIFARNMFIRPGHDALADFEPAFTVLHAPYLEADPAQDGT
ncbi:MAG: phosphoenolpyruvate carboxykinase (ATP), partial [Rhodospirillales bacterium]|nr:phosphoenolpyruvate carboxykinase (ATP) [Rhodospirillales bacterium]